MDINQEKLSNSLLVPTENQRNIEKNARTIALHTVGTSTGITNVVRQNESNPDSTNVRPDRNSALTHSPVKIPSSKNNALKEGNFPMENKLPEKFSFAETQFYARTSATPPIQRKLDDVCSSPPGDDTFHDAIDELSAHKDIAINRFKGEIKFNLIFVDFPEFLSRKNFDV